MRLARMLCAALALAHAAYAADDFEALRAAIARGDYSAAVPALQAAAGQNDPRALNLLGTLYQQGSAFPHDPAKAFELYARAAELGDAEAQFNLGNLYLLGQGVQQDDAWAMTYFRKAAAQGHAQAAASLDKLYRAAGLPVGGASSSAAPVVADGADAVPPGNDPAAAAADTAASSVDELAAIEMARAAGIEVKLDDTGSAPLDPASLPEATRDRKSVV